MLFFLVRMRGYSSWTQNGEIWVNKVCTTFTTFMPQSYQYIMICTWMGSPSIYVYDCSHRFLATHTHTHTHTHNLFAGLILDSFKVFARQRDSDCFMDSPQSSSQHLGLNSWYATHTHTHTHTYTHTHTHYFSLSLSLMAGASSWLHVEPKRCSQ